MCQILLWVKNPKGPFGKQIQSAPEFQMTKIFRYQERLLRRGSVWAGIEGSGKVDIGGGAGHSSQKGQPVHRQRGRTCAHTKARQRMSLSLGVGSAFSAQKPVHGDVLSCFCKTKSLPRSSASWNARTPRNLETSDIFLYAHHFLMRTTVQSSPGVQGQKTLENLSSQSVWRQQVPMQFYFCVLSTLSGFHM